MKRPADFIPTTQRMIAVTALGPSTLRGQGKGVLKASQEFVAKVQLNRIPDSHPSAFKNWLDRQTELLLDVLPAPGRPWGAARKAMNLFLRDCLYNQYINEEYRISKVEAWLEVPLDSAVATGLRNQATSAKLPRWTGLKHLKPEMSAQYQLFALHLANEWGMHRVHLDIYLWLENRNNVI